MNFSLKQLNRCDYYVLIWWLYQMQGFLYPEGPIGQVLQAILIVWAGIEAKDYLLPNKRNPSLLKATFLLLFMYCIYGIPLAIFNPIGISRPHVYLQEFITSFLPIFLFYKYLNDGVLTEKRLKRYICLFLVVAVWHYFKYEQESIAKLRLRGSKRDEITNNTGYEFLALIPITFFFYRKPLLQYSLLCLNLLFIVMAMKRGPILIGAICFIWVLIMNVKAAENKKYRYATIFLGFMIILAGLSYITYQMENSDYMSRRIEETKEGNTSGRDHLYSDVLEKIVDDTSVSHLLIGRGAWSTISFLGKPAHQDWLETAVNNGLVGIVILINFCFNFFLTVVKKNETIPKPIHTAYVMMFFIFVFKTMFSMSLGDMPCFQSMLISFCIYNKENHECIIS